VRAVALRAAKYPREDAGAPHAGLESAGGVEIIGRAIAAGEGHAGAGTPRRPRAETAPKRAQAPRHQKAIRRVEAPPREDAKCATGE